MPRDRADRERYRVETLSEAAISTLNSLFLSVLGGIAAVTAVLATEDPAAEDPRQFVEMPAQARALMRQDMLDHLATVTTLIGLVGKGQFEEAAEVAESKLGRSAMGKHRGTGTPPGRYMPDAMRSLGMGLHEAASEFAVTAKTEDQAATFAALQNLMSSCVACHATFRTR